MKTVVVGLFDEIEPARRVLIQLATTPLDVDSIEVVHADPEVQAALSGEAGLPKSRAMPLAAIAGACLGGALGALAGNGWLAALGPLLATALGVLVGGALGLLVGALSVKLAIPPEHLDELTAAIGQGATALIVRTHNLTTARAIGDLFAAAGSRALSPLAEAHTETEVAAEVVAVAGSPAEPAATPEEHVLFAPPWRRGVADPEDIEDVPLAPPAHLDPSADELPLAAGPGPIAPAPRQEPELAALGLSSRVTGALVMAGITTLPELRARATGGEEALRSIPGIGPKAAEEIQAGLRAIDGNADDPVAAGYAQDAAPERPT